MSLNRINNAIEFIITLATNDVQLGKFTHINEVMHALDKAVHEMKCRWDDIRIRTIYPNPDYSEEKGNDKLDYSVHNLNEFMHRAHLALRVLPAKAAK